MRSVLLFLLISVLAVDGFSQKTFTVRSPDERIVFHLAAGSSSLKYSVRFKGRLLVSPSLLRLHFSTPGENPNYTFAKPVIREGSENYTLIVGKRKHVRSRYRELVLPVVCNKERFDVVVRLFNDGVGFRYVLKEGKRDSFQLHDEQTEFRINQDPAVRTLFLPHYTSSHEGLYSKLPFRDIPGDTLMAMPSLFHWENGPFLAVTEAALLDYAGMYLTKKDNVLRGVLSPLPGNPDIKVKGTFPHNSPWRVLMVGDSIGSLIDSDILTNLNSPPAFTETGWIRPGKTTFPWWNGNVLPDTINAPGNNFVTQKYYIDFCARNNIEYHSVVEYGLHQWYVDDGVGFQPGLHNNVTQPVPGLDMKEVCDYAATKGVGVRVWVHWAALYPRIDSAFAIFEKWGLKGMMIDFMDRDDQEMVNIQTEMLEKAAKHHLHVQFHGAYKPTGLSRTYPNELTREGALNYEYNKWDKTITADHDLNIVFTRMLAGPTDYHLGGFRFVHDSAFRAQYTRPLIISTKAHMLAMYVVLENYLGMVADYPEAYEGKAGFDFIKEVPTVWDDTRTVAAKPDQYAIIARKNKSDWWLGAISNHEKRAVDISLAFLGKDKYRALIYSDGEATAEDPNQIVFREIEVSGNSSLTLNLAGNGGAAIRFVKL